MGQRPFRFGVINEQVFPREAWVAHVRRVEAEGYATFLIRDHFVPDYFGDQLGPVAALMTAANMTETLRIGSLVFDNDYRHPVMLAKEAATIDLLSGGRLELGLGAGWLETEYRQAGMPYHPAGIRISRLEEAIRVIKGLWAEEPLTFAGEHYTIEDLNGFPKPTQRPHPPLLIGAGQKRMLRLAGREANTVGVLTTSVATGVVADAPDERLPEAVAQKLAWVREGAGARFETLELSLVPSIVVTDKRRQQTEQFIRDRQWQGISVEQVWTMPSVFIGSIEQICEDMEARRAQYGFSYYVVSDTVLEQFAPVVARLAGR